MTEVVSKGIEILHQKDGNTKYKPFVIFYSDGKLEKYFLEMTSGGYMFSITGTVMDSEEMALSILNREIKRKLEYEKKIEDTTIIKREVKYINE